MRRSRPVLAALSLLVAAAACTGTPATEPGSRPSRSASPSESIGPVRFLPGRYRYDFGGVTASLVFSGSTATMDVKNASGAELGAPGVYVIDGSDRRWDGRVAGTTPIPDGETASFDVTFPDQVTEKTIGLVILKFGDANWGAFAPAAAAVPLARLATS